MKAILKYLMLTVFVSALSIACRDESLNPIPDMNDNVGAVTLIAVNPARTFYNLSNPLVDEFVEFTIDVDGFGITEVTSVDLELIFTENDRVYDPFQDVFVDSVYDAVLIKSVSTFPSTIQITPAELATALGISIDDFELGDNFNVVFPINTADGRRLTTALNSELCNQPAQPSFGGCNVTWVLTCPSNLGGDIDFVTTNITAGVGGNAAACGGSTSGTAEFDDQGGGIYEISDATFGQYACAWDDSPAAGVSLVDVCGLLSLTGADQYDLVYSISIVSNDGTELIIDWENDYGDSGRSTLTRTDGKDWPLDLHTD